MSFWDTIGDIAGSLIGGSLSSGSSSGTAASGGASIVQPPNLMTNTMVASKDIQRPKVKAANEQSKYLMDDPYSLAKAWSGAFEEHNNAK